MENYILYRYKEWLKTREGNLLKQLSSLTVGAIILLTSLFVTLLAILVVAVLLPTGETIYTNLSFILMGIEVILITITSIYSEKIQIAHSKKNFKNYKVKCNELGDFLIENGLTSDFVPMLIERLNTKISEIEQMIKHKHEAVNKFMEMLLIPISAIILGAMLDKETSILETFGIGISGLLIVFLIYGIIILTLFLYDIVMRIPEEKYKQFISDLQGFLDFEECEKNYKKVLLEDVTH